MSYRIEYGPAVPEKYLPKQHPFRLQLMTALFFLLFSFSVRQVFPEGTARLRSLLLPAAPSVTQEALSAFMEDLRLGEPFHDSFTAFCAYLIDHDEKLPG